MNKTPEQLAEEWAIDWHKDCDYPDAILEIRQEATKHIFLAGYKVAQEHAHAALEEAEAKMQELRDQIAGVSKVMPDSCEHILDMEKMVDVNGWISVKDRLPEIGQAVNCYGRTAYESGSSVIPAWYIHKWNQWQSCEGDGCGGGGYLFDVTHWMPLPEPPKEEK